MIVSVVFPYRSGGCVHREMAHDWVTGWWADEFPAWEQVTGESPDGPFSRSAAILDGAAKARGEVLVFADADVWCSPAAIRAAVQEAVRYGWAVPHTLIRRLSREATDEFMASDDLGSVDLTRLRLDQSNKQDRRPYRGNPTGTLVVFRRDVFDAVPPDPRFRGWGQEDEAWGRAAHTLIGPPWRGDADLVHLWHPPAARIDRQNGNHEGMALRDRYDKVTGNRPAMAELVEEARAAWGSELASLGS